MSGKSRKSHLAASVSPNPKPVNARSTTATSAKPGAVDTDLDVLLRLIPDQVFRIRAIDDSAIAVLDERTGLQVAGSAPQVGDSPAKDGRGGDCSGGLAGRLASFGKQLIDGFVETGLMQTLEIQVESGGRVIQYEIRSAGCGPGEIVAVATDVTARKEADASIARALSEVERLNEILRNEASLHAEDEQIMDNAFAKLGKLLEDTIGAIQMIVKQKDPPTAQHQARVCKLACAIAGEMGLEKAQVDTIGLAALLHDLGKVFIPTDTLNKPGRLTEDEYAAVKNSAETEFQILKIIDLFYPIADIVHQHHERLNGSGYPLGLAGDDILTEARIIAVADVVEAMVSERPYRPAHSPEAALNEIETGKGILYDPRAVEACVKLLRESGFSFDQAKPEPSQEPAYSGL